MHWLLYNLLFPVVFVCMLPRFIARMLRRGGYGPHFLQRLGRFDPDTLRRLSQGERIWVHAVSVGEINVALQFIRAWREAHPAASFVLSTNTSTAHALASKALDARDVLIYFPVDLPLIMRKVLARIRPARIVLVEGEFWPNLMRLADRSDIPVALINGRLSERSFKGYRLLRRFTADILRRLDVVCVQSEMDAARMKKLGARPERVEVMGSVKFDTALRDEAGRARAEEIVRPLLPSKEALILLGGSTWPGEEMLLAEQFMKLRKGGRNLFLVLVPRHAERADAVMRELTGLGLNVLRRSQLQPPSGSVVSPSPDVLLVDTTGELSGYYAAADIVFVGKSLRAHGGQNPIEPAVCSKPVIVGPHMENFAEVVQLFLKDDAVLQVVDENDLEQQLVRLMDDAAFRDALGRRAGVTVAAHQGVMKRTVHAVMDK